MHFVSTCHSFTKIKTSMKRLAFADVQRTCTPLVRLIEGVQRRIRHFSDGSSDLNNKQEKMVVKFEEGTIWGTSIPRMRWRYADQNLDLVCRDRSSFEFWKTVAGTRLWLWSNWVESNNELWWEKNEKEQRSDLEARWSYLRDLLHAVGMDTRYHRQLLSIKYTRRGMKFTIASPEKGLTSIKYLRYECGGGYQLPWQTVNGLVCFSIDEAFFIYNPTTGEKSSWTETTTVSEENREVDCIELGFCPKSNQHKVICISSGINKKSAALEFSQVYGEADQQVGAEDQIVEILTVGENTWRRIDAVPPYCVGSESEDVERPYYVNGSIYWRFQYTRNGGEVVMGFDFESEKFRVIPIPEAARIKFLQPIQLTEVDGCVAVVEHNTPAAPSLWVLIEDADGSFVWIEEEFLIPHEATWNENGDASIQVLKGTNLIFVQPENSTCFYYCNRDSKEFVRFPISPDRHDNSFERIMQL